MTQAQITAIERYLHYTNEPFDTWEWDGEYLSIFLNDTLIERYHYNDLLLLIENFEEL